LNLLVFPAPKPTWNYNEYLGEMIWIPAKKDGVGQEVFNRRIIEKSEKGENPGVFTNVTETVLLNNKKKISAFYHYSTNGSDFTHDMHEKHHPITPIRNTANLKMDFIATKKFGIKSSSDSSSDNKE